MNTDLFEATLRDLLANPSEGGWEAQTVGDADGSTLCWFANARNAASWVASQDPERFGTQYEYRLRPVPVGTHRAA